MSRKRGHGEGSIYAHGTGYRGSIRYIDPGTRKRRRKYVTGKTRKEVADKLADVRRQLDAQVPMVEAKDTVTAAVAAYLDMHKDGPKSPTTIRDNRYLTARRITPYIGHVRLDELDEAVVRDWQRRLLDDGLSPAYVQKARQVLAQVIDVAIDAGHLRRNAVRATPPPRNPPKEAASWTSDQVARLLAAAKDTRSEALFRFIAYTGVRKGEALALRWCDIDLDAGRAHITGTLVRVDGRLRRNPPKTKASRATIDLHPLAVDALHAAREQQDTDRAGSKHWTNPTGYVFTTASGEPVDPDNAGRAMRTIRDKAGLEAGAVHTLRHSFAAHALEAGANIQAISRHLRHSRVSITLDVYGHFTETGVRDQVFAGLEGYAQATNVTPLRAVGE